MFVQIIEGRTSDREGFWRQADRWMREVRPGATGFLGATEGVADDGRVVVLARFESADAARASSERREQGEWWAETEKYFDGDVTFHDSEDVDLWLGGGSNDAGFVQIMKGRADRQRLLEMDRELEPHVASYRPDLLGGLRVWIGPDQYVEAAYFTDEAEARVNETKEPPPELASAMAELQETMAGVEFIDLREPRLF